MVKSVVVIGAGPSGLTTVKACLDVGMEPICFEKSDDIGGLWHCTSKLRENRTTVMGCTIANVSKELTSFSDFPVPKEFPIYMPASLFKEYLRLYADHFDLRKYVRFQTEVVSVTETADHVTTGQWHVRTKSVVSGDSEDIVVDCVCVCNGVSFTPVIPSFPGSEGFKGKTLHARDYHSSAGFEGKRVVVVGAGNSAGDVACDISNVAQQVYLSTRNGGWVVTRQSDNGAPVDIVVMTKFKSSFLKMIPKLSEKIMVKMVNSKLDHEKYGLCPKYPPMRSNVIVSDEISFKLMNGKIKMKPGIKQLSTRNVVFNDGSVIEDVDVIVFATGYKPDFPFLSKDIIGEDKEQLYMTVFPRQRKTSTLAVIGNTRVRGPALPVLELQARYAAAVFEGDTALPDQATMATWVERNIRESRQHRLYSIRGVPQVDFVEYNDELATLIGCKPSIRKLLFTDFSLAMKCLFGPATAYQHRLTGPGAWPGARDAIMGQTDRTYYSLTDGRYMAEHRKHQTGGLWRRVLVAGILVAVVLSYALM